MDLLIFPKIAAGRVDTTGYDDWVATEKIHGAQVVVGVDERGVRIGKRKGWLEPDEPFFAWQMLRPTLEAAGHAVHAALGTSGRTWIYGELFGGRYPHPNVAEIPGLMPVQTGIWYAPTLEYAVFDIVHEAAGYSPVFLAQAQVADLARPGGLRCAPRLGRGRLADLDHLPVRYVTQVPALFGLPAIADNLAEGYVLKPAGEATISRPAVKRKIAEFDELRFDESSAFNAKALPSEAELLALAQQLVNHARLAAARSKVGADPRRIVEEAVLDALIDLRDMLPLRCGTLSTEQEQRLQRQLEERATELLSAAGQ